MNALTRDEVIQMAREAGFDTGSAGIGVPPNRISINDTTDAPWMLDAMTDFAAAAYARGVADARDSASANHIPDAGKMVQDTPPTYGSEEVRKLRETIASFARIVNVQQCELVAATSRPWVGLSGTEIDMIYEGVRAVHGDTNSDVFAHAIESALRAKNEAQPLAITGCSYCLNKTAYKLTPTCTECGHDMLTAHQIEAAQALIDQQAARALGANGGAK